MSGRAKRRSLRAVNKVPVQRFAGVLSPCTTIEGEHSEGDLLAGRKRSFSKEKAVQEVEGK